MAERGEHAHGTEPDFSDKDVDPKKMELIDKITEAEGEIYGFCLKKIRGRPNARSDARDITQDVICKAVNKISQLKDDALLKPWLYRIAINEIHAYFRKTGAWESKEDEGANLESKETGKATAEEQMIVREKEGKKEAAVRKALKQMPDSYSKPLILYEFEDKSYDEIAAEMGLSLAAVKTRISRAREKIRKILSGLGYGGMKDFN